MTRWKLVFLITLLLSSFAAESRAAGTFYVDNSGSPVCSNSPTNGSAANPWCTVAYGVSRLSSGDTLYVKQGTYSGNFSIKGPAGTPSARTRILAYPGHTVVLNGSGFTSGRIKIAATSYIDFEGFTITNHNQGLYIDNDAGTDAPATFVNVRNVTVYSVGQEGIAIRGGVHDILVENCTVYDTGKLSGQNGEGIYTGTSSRGADNVYNVTIRNCAIHDTQDEMVELKAGSHDVIVEGCTFYGTIRGSSFSNGAGLIELDEPESYPNRPAHIIRNNVFRDLSASGFESVIRAGAGSDIYNNVMYNVGNITGITSNAKFTGTGTSHLRRIYHNTIDRPGASAFQNSGTTVDVRNNIGPTGTNNLAISSAYFLDYEAHDYHLAAGSAPINAGLDLTSIVSADIDGVSRRTSPPPDLGAHEYVSVGSVLNAPTSLILQ
jgi:hypothetical protein